ncbi:MAG: methyltransferase domain-containing protein [Nanoarchaeota archaeon]|nr:methyltransferase domain-containing protein [Nanoarchaeota archaeon]
MKPDIKKYDKWTGENMRRFDNWAESYDNSILNPVFAYAHYKVINSLSPDDRKILDIGCGTGKLLSKVYALDKKRELVGIDFSEDMIKIAKQKRGGHIDYLVADSSALPFKDNYFDAIVNTFSFHHYIQQEKVLGEMNRVLKPKGKLCIVDHSFSHPPGLIYLMSPILNLLEGPVKINKRGEMKKMLKEQGFSVLSSRSFTLIGTLYKCEKI